MSTLTTQKLDSNGDLSIVNGSIELLRDGDALSQILTNKLKLFKGEFSLEPEEGLDWLTLLSSSVNAEEILAVQIRKLLLADSHVIAVEAIELDFDRSESKMNGYFRVLSTFGTVTGSI